MAPHPLAPRRTLDRALVIAAWLVFTAGTAFAEETQAAARPPASLAARLEASMPGPWPLFPPNNWWNTEVSAAPIDPGSAAFINYINQGGVKHLHPDLGGTLSDGIGIYG